MSSEQGLARPLGWWLKEADAQINAAFDTALAGTGLDRRGWQLLASLASQPMARPDLIASLTPFEPAAAVEQVIAHMRAHRWVEESGGLLRLTSAGAEQQQALAPLVDGVRQQVSKALSREDYITLVGLLSRLVDSLQSGHERP